MKFRNLCLAFLLVWCISGTSSQAQEQLVPLRYQPMVAPQAAAPLLLKSTAQSLPFFEDFTGTMLYPDATRWVFNRQVYCSKTMGINPVAHSVAVFDALNASGRPYDTTSPFSILQADSLTSAPFNLAAYQPADNIYLSFFFQPQGNGFSPETPDSLMLFFRAANGQWLRQWAQQGTTLQPFRQIILPVTDTAFLYNGFQFRFINKASVNLNDDVWLVDYIRLNSGRSPGDTVLQDVALTQAPANLLGDYTSMPYRHYAANAAAERGNALDVGVRNNSPQSRTTTLGYTATDTRNGTVLGSGNTSLSIAAGAIQSATLPVYSTVPQAGPDERVVFRHQFYITPPAGLTPDANDTLVKEQVFDNYFAYDDGTAEKAYFLNLLASLPGKLAIEHYAQVPDTLRGAAILFGQQVPTSANKFFSLQVYRTIAGIDGATTDQLLHSQDYYSPRYTDTVNGFYYYTFDQPVPLPAGTFYLGLMQPASSGSDSLYYALDANRIGSNHLYYNVDGSWRSSTVSGALMARPLVGAPVAPTAVSTLLHQQPRSLYPNPSSGTFHLSNVPLHSRVKVTDLTGRSVAEVQHSGQAVALPNLAAGTYFVRWQDASGKWSAPQKWLLMSGL